MERNDDAGVKRQRMKSWRVGDAKSAQNAIWGRPRSMAAADLDKRRPKRKTGNHRYEERDAISRSSIADLPGGQGAASMFRFPANRET